MLQNLQGKAVGIQQSEALRIARQPTHEGDKVVSFMHRSPLFHNIFLVLVSVRD